MIGFLLLTGRVYKHDAYVYEISPECEVERAHTPREENRHEITRPSLPEHLLVRSCQQNDEGEGQGGSDATTEEHFDAYGEGCKMRMWVEMSRASMAMHAYAKMQEMR